jgi:threonine dehydratase
LNAIPDKSSIDLAAKRIRNYINHTPVLTSENLNELTESELFFKCENFQKAGAFKSRGAINAIFSLTDEELQKGVCTHSSGNHAAALSRAAGLRKVKAYIVMPGNSSVVKVAAVKHYGGIITFCENNLASRESTLARIQRETGSVEIHPYNNYRIIAGQATASKELTESVPQLDIVMAPVGGGGLLAGTLLACKFYSPGTEVIAAEPSGADDAFRSFYGQSFVPSINPTTIADGLLTSLGNLTFPIIKKNVQQIVTVNEESIIAAMRLIWERMKIIVEPSSAVPFGAILENKFRHKGKRIGIILSGGNIDLDKIPWFMINKQK